MADTTSLTDADDNIQTSMDIQYEAQKRKKYIYGGVALLLTLILIIVIIVATTSGSSSSSGSTSVTYPIIIATWNRRAVVDAAWEAMEASTTDYKSLDAAVAGVQYCQENCNNAGAVNVDTQGDVTQSAMVIFGHNMESGSVANLYNIRDAVSVAKDVLIYTRHAMLVGESASEFALQQNRSNTFNFSRDSRANNIYSNWTACNCNATNYPACDRGGKPFWRNVQNGNGCTLADDDNDYEQDKESSIKDITGCAVENATVSKSKVPPGFETQSDGNLGGPVVTGSISVLAIDEEGEMSLATSSNGLAFKIAGRVSDAAVIGAGGYINPAYGGCVATGAGDTLIRFLPAKHAVTLMGEGYSPEEAAEKAVAEVEPWCPDQQLVIICLSKDGEPGMHQNEGTSQSYAYRSNKCQAAVRANKTFPRGSCL